MADVIPQFVIITLALQSSSLATKTKKIQLQPPNQSGNVLSHPDRLAERLGEEQFNIHPYFPP
jgi:hypothetical protein